MSIFKKLWHGDICIAESCVPQTDEYRKATHTLSEASEILYSQLTEKQKQEFEEYQNARADYEIILQINIYKQGAQFGFELAQELSVKN